MLQGLLVLPALGSAYLLAARVGLWTQIRHLLVAAAELAISAGWLIALAAVWPATSRPYIGGSETNSLWELAIGYNGAGSKQFDRSGHAAERDDQPLVGRGDR